MDNLEKAEITASIHRIVIYWFTILEPLIRLAEKQEEEEHRQLESVLRLAPTQKNLPWKIYIFPKKIFLYFRMDADKV